MLRIKTTKIVAYWAGVPRIVYGTAIECEKIKR